MDSEICFEASGVPPLYGLDLLVRDNALFCAKTCRMHCTFQHVGVEEIDLPQRVRIFQRERVHGGHRLLGVNHWDSVSNEELQRVRAIMSPNQRVVDK